MQNNEVPIRRYTISKRGLRGYVLTLPRVWLEDVHAKEGDTLTVYRDTEDRLIIVREDPVVEMALSAANS